jgi:flagellar biosynthesis protein FlhG
MIMPKMQANLDKTLGLHLVKDVHPVRAIAVTGGKGGVGKTNLAVNLSIALAQLGKAVMLFDGDLSLANVDLLLGLSAQYNLSDVIEGRCKLKDIILTGPAGIQIVPAASGTARMCALSPAQHAGVIQAFSELTCPLDILMIDTATGIADGVVSFTRAATEVLMVVCDEPTSLTDAYALIKLLHREHNINQFYVVANMVREAEEGQKLYQKLSQVTDRFLDVQLRYLGAVPYEKKARQAVQQQKAMIELYPTSPGSIAIQEIAQAIMKLPIDSDVSGHIGFFIERLVEQKNCADAEMMI